MGMPRRNATYQPQDGFTWMNQLSTVSAMILGVSMLPFIFNVYITARTARNRERPVGLRALARMGDVLSAATS